MMHSMIGDRPRWFNSEPVYLGWKDFGPFWFPWLPLTVTFVVAAVFTGGWARAIWVVLAAICLSVTILALRSVVRSRHR